MARKVKRKRGGQKGNQNARKHGLYSARLKGDEFCRVLNIMTLENVDQELAVIRARLDTVLERCPGNNQAILAIAKSLAKYSAAKYNLDKPELKLMKTYFRELLLIKSAAAMPPSEKAESTI